MTDSLHSRIEKTVDALKEAYILALQAIPDYGQYHRELCGIRDALADASGLQAQTVQIYCEMEAKKRRECVARWTNIKRETFMKIERMQARVEAADGGQS